MASYTTKYIFQFDVQGQEAVRKAQQMASAINDAINKATTPKTTTATGGGASKQITAEVERTKTAFDDFAETMQQLEIRYFGLRRLSYGLQSTGRDLTQAGLMTIRAMTSMAQSYLTFNEASTRTAIAMELPVKMQDELEESTMRLSETAGSFSATELMQALRVWAMGTGATIETTQELNDTLAQTVEISRMAAMNDVDLAAATDYVGGVMNQFQTGVSGVNDIVAVLNFQSAKTFATVEDLGTAFKYVGPIAAEMGTTYQELAVVFGDLARAQISGSMAGRGVRQMYIRLNQDIPKVTEAMNELLQVNTATGESWRDIIFPGGKFIGLYDYLDIIAAATENMNDAEKEQYLAVLATANELPALLRMVEMTTLARKKGISYYRAGWKEQQGIMDEEVMAYAELREEIDKMPYSIQNAVTLWNQSTATWLASDSANMINLQNAWDNALTKIGKVVLQEGMGTVEQFTDGVKDLADFVEKNPWVARLTLDLALLEVGFGTATTAAGKLLQMLTNVLIMSQILPKVLPLLGSALAALAGPAVVAGVAAAWGTLIYIIVNGSKNIEAALKEEAKQYGSREEYVRQRYEEAKATGALGAAYYDENGILQQNVMTLEEFEQSLHDGGDEVYKMLRAQESLRDAMKFSNMTLEESIALIKEMATAEEMLPSRRREILTGTVAPPAIIEPYVRPSLGGMAPVDFEEYVDKWQPLIDRLLQYQERAKDAERDFQQSMKDMARDFQYQLDEYDLDRARSRLDIYEDYDTQVADAARDLDKQLAKLHADYLLDEERSTEDHDKRMADMRAEYLLNEVRAHEDHVENLREFAAKADARGMLNELREYKKEKTRRNEDYTKQVKDEEDSYALQQKRRKEDYDLRVQEIRDSNAERLAEARKGMEERLLQFDEETARQRQQMIDRYRRQAALAREEHDREMAELKKEADEELEEMLRALTLPEEDLRRIFLSRMVKLQEYLGIEIDMVNTWYANALREAAKKAWAAFWEQYREEEAAGPTPAPGPTTTTPTGRGAGGEPTTGEPVIPATPTAPSHYHLTAWEHYGYTYGEWLKLPYNQRRLLLEGWVPGMATGGLIATTGVYRLEAGERVVPLPSAHAPLGTMGGQTAAGEQPILIRVEQTNWHFDGSMSEADKEWYRRASKESAYEAITEAFKK